MKKKRSLPDLKTRDLRSIGNSHEAVALVLANPELVSELVAGLMDRDRLVRMRSADALEKATREHPDWLQPWKRYLLDEVAARPEKELRWHVAQLLPRLELTSAEKDHAVEILNEYLRDKSSIVRTFSMQALADLAENDAALRGQALPLIERLTHSGTPAMRARGRKLLQKLNIRRELS